MQFYGASVNGRMPTVPHLEYRVNGVKCLKYRASENIKFVMRIYCFCATKISRTKCFVFYVDCPTATQTDVVSLSERGVNCRIIAPPTKVAKETSLFLSSPSTQTISSQSQGSDATYEPFDSEQMEGGDERLVNYSCLLVRQEIHLKINIFV